MTSFKPWEYRAEAGFVNVFQKHETPSDIQMIALTKALRLVDVIFDNGLAASRSEARRLVEQRGVKVDHHIVTNADFLVEPKTGLIIQVGKRRFARLQVK